jgi:predicted RNA-binding protein YlxR (DUF448 family)
MPIRTCVACGQRDEKHNLLRITESLELDFAQKVPGRGAYVCKNDLCVEKLHKKNTISRSLKMSVSKSGLDSVIKQLRMIDERDDS